MAGWDVRSGGFLGVNKKGKWMWGDLVIFVGQFDEDIFEGGAAAGDFADFPMVLGGEAEGICARVGISVEFQVKDAGSFEEFFGDFFDPGELAEEFLAIGSVVGFDAHPSGGSMIFEEIFWGIAGADGAFVDDDDAGAHDFDFGEDMGGDEDGSLATEVFDELADLADLVGVEADGGFIEDE